MHYTESKNIDGLLMLIDFEKAFDSLSWQFLYKVLHFFGFKESMIRWIKLFNNEFQASILQCGFLSKPFKIGRGAKQGDPIACNLFILCGEILSILIRHNDLIRGIFINNVEHKLAQFADDTTLLLDGSEHSLVAALNTLEIFGSFSGLKMNLEKTKVIWVGRKKFCKDKLNIGINLDWTKSTFSLLGLEFSVNLNDMVEINYNKTIAQCSNILNNWKKRLLTPIGKITVIKTFIIPKFNHLFISLPSPNPSILTKLSKLIFDYIWDGKPDKINRKQLAQDYLNGGLKMLDLPVFIKCLKTTWIRRLQKGSNASWRMILDPDYKISNGIFVFGSQWCSVVNKEITNPFWIDVFKAWKEVSENNKIISKEDIVASPIWYNCKLSTNPTFFPHWFRKGIIFINDVIDCNFRFLSLQSLNTLYNINELDFLNYYKIKLQVESFLSKHLCEEMEIENYPQLPFLPFQIKILYKNIKGGRDFYNLLTKTNLPEPKMKSKWNQDLNIIIDKFTWRNVYKICFKTVKDTRLIWLQYRILYRILGTRCYLYKLNIEEIETCRLCIDRLESIMHLFVNCTIAKTLWLALKKWIFNVINLNVDFTNCSIILGYLNTDSNCIPINVIIIVAKYYLFYCASTRTQINFETFKRRLKKVYSEEQNIARTEFKLDIFIKKWTRWEPLFV